MGIIPILKARDVIAVLIRTGFRLVHSRGSHFRFEHVVTKRRLTLVVHAGKDITRKALRSILNQAGLTLEEFLKYLGRK